MLYGFGDQIGSHCAKGKEHIKDMCGLRDWHVYCIVTM